MRKIALHASRTHDLFSESMGPGVVLISAKIVVINRNNFEVWWDLRCEYCKERFKGNVTLILHERGFKLLEDVHGAENEAELLPMMVAMRKVYKDAGKINELERIAQREVSHPLDRFQRDISDPSVIVFSARKRSQHAHFVQFFKKQKSLSGRSGSAGHFPTIWKWRERSSTCPTLS